MTIESRKKLFLKKYYPSRSIEKALSGAIKASVQHNSLYADNTDEKDKIKIRKEWKKLLDKFSKKYEFSQTVEIYENDIIQLKEIMNEKFSMFFRNTKHPKYKYDTGFRISHSQKSLSIFLKFLWCAGEIKTPPQCPVDAVILGMAGKKYPDKKWGFVNSIEIHQEKISWIENAVSKYNSIPANERQINNLIFEKGRDLEIAEWELAHFNPKTKNT